MNVKAKSVFDCNVYLQAMISVRGPAHECWRRAVIGEISLYVSNFVLAEIRSLKARPKLRRFVQLTSERVDGFIMEVLDVAVLIEEPPDVFQYSRDPDDAHYINLAIATDSRLIVSNDKDLHDLSIADNPDGVRLRAMYPDFRVLTPAELLATLATTNE
jgi:putative PIN family toxin of toxin-antitoxin system